MRITDTNIERIIESLLEFLINCEDGEEYSTVELLKKVFPDVAFENKSDLMRIHYELDKKAKENGILLDINAFNESYVGMPYDLCFEVLKGFSKIIDVDAAELRAYFLMEKPFPEIENADVFYNLTESVDLTLDDLKAVTNTIIKNSLSSEKLRVSWILPLEDMLNDRAAFIKVESESEDITGLPSPAAYFWDAYNMIDFYSRGEAALGLDYLEKELLPFIETAIIQKQLSPFERQYTPAQKKSFIHYMNDEKKLEDADKRVIKLFVDFTNELCEKGVKEALYAKAYGCYGGNRAFDCDWTVSRDILIKLTEIDEDPFLFNSLGYIYYYGRCTDGVPEYEKAFHAYSIGAAGGVYESKYKLADMFLKGNGVPENHRIAASLIYDLYDENLNVLLKGCYDCKFADVALRMGGLAESGVNRSKPDPLEAYYYYLQAKEALKLRRTANYYGDKVVANKIDGAITQVKSKLGEKVQKQSTVELMSIEQLIGLNLTGKRRIKVKVKKLKNGSFSLNFSAVKRNIADPAKLFITIPELGYCRFVEHITVNYMPYDYEYSTFNDRIRKQNVFVFDEISFNSIFDYDKEIACFYGILKVTVRNASDDRKISIVSVCFHEGGRTYDYVCDLEGVKPGDKVIVNGYNGESAVTVVSIEKHAVSDLALPEDAYKKIIRKVQ